MRNVMVYAGLASPGVGLQTVREQAGSFFLGRIGLFKSQIHRFKFSVYVPSIFDLKFVTMIEISFFCKEVRFRQLHFRPGK